MLRPICLLVASCAFASACSPSMLGSPDATDPAVDATAADAGLDARGDDDDDAHAAADASPVDASAPSEDAAGADYGRCGRVVADCRCRCGADTACRQACNNDAVACSDCVSQASARCCPAQYAAAIRCYQAAIGATDGGAPRDAGARPDASGGGPIDGAVRDADGSAADADADDAALPPCTDAACVRVRCAAPYAAFNACLQSAVTASPQCRAGFAACFGTATCM